MGHRQAGRRAVIALAIGIGAVAAGSVTDVSATTEPVPPSTDLVAETTEAPMGTDPAVASEAPAATDAVGSTEGSYSTEAGTATEASGSEWERVVPGGDCECADGSEFAFFVRQADPTKVVFFLEGGGACFSAESCAFDEDTSTYTSHLGPNNDPSVADGIFALDNPENPFADYSMIFVPYCTGDVHIGNATTEYSPELTVEHKGAVNGAAAVAYLGDEFADAESVVVVGESAGSVAAPLYSGLISDALPDADIAVFADGSGGYPNDPALNEFVGNLWGTMNAVPDWEVNEGMTVQEWSLPGLWVQAGTHDPDIVMSRFDYAFDQTQVFFVGLVGVDAAGLVDFMDENEAWIEAAGVDQASFTAPGDDHTLVRRPEFYEMEVNGVSLVDWVTEVVAGDDVEDVHCTDCEAPAS